MDIVTGFDGSPASWRAFFFALGIAQRERAFIHVTFVYHVPAPAWSRHWRGHLVCRWTRMVENSSARRLQSCEWPAWKVCLPVLTVTSRPNWKLRPRGASLTWSW